MSNKICPLLLLGFFASQTAPEFKCSCMKENCAWFATDRQTCAVLSIADNITISADDIIHKMAK